jgi:hypothetical protein
MPFSCFAVGGEIESRRYIGYRWLMEGRKLTPQINRQTSGGLHSLDVQQRLNSLDIIL